MSPVPVKATGPSQKSMAAKVCFPGGTAAEGQLRDSVWKAWKSDVLRPGKAVAEDRAVLGLVASAPWSITRVVVTQCPELRARVAPALKPALFAR